MMLIKVGDIVELANEQNSWTVANIDNDYCTCVECSEFGLTGTTRTVQKNQIISIKGNDGVWKSNCRF